MPAMPKPSMTRVPGSGTTSGVVTRARAKVAQERRMRVRRVVICGVVSG